MDCADAKLRMEPCASGALVPEELALFEEHIASCEGCRLELELVRAMGEGKAGEAGGAKGDDWTLDRIFGAEAAKNPPTSSPDSESFAIAPITAGADQPAPAASAASAPPAPPAASAPSETASIFETTPNPAPPEAPASSASAPSVEHAPAPADVIPPAPAAAHDQPGDSNLFDEPNPVTAISDEVLAAAASVLAPAAPKAPRAATPPAARTVTPPAAPPATEPAAGDSWDFEPADAKPEGSLPEGSLFFAEETLARQGTARKGKNTVKRMVLWGAGAVVGIAFLVVSLWIGFFSREGEADFLQQAPVTKAARPEPTEPVAAPESVALSTPDGSAAGSPSATMPEVVTQRADEAVAQPPASSVMGARALSGSGVPPVPPSTRSGSQPVAPRSTTGASAATSSGKGIPKGTKTGTATTATGATKTGATAPPAATSKSSAGSTAPATVTTRPEPQPLDPEQLELLAPPPVSTPPEQNVPFAGGTKGAAGNQSAPVRNTPTPQVSTSPAPAESAPAAPPADQVQRPIDRLHLATVAAEQGSDLVALRKLRDTWKGVVRTSVGPDRMRAKRELGDCLWAIQSLTGRTSDKRGALAAYREYLLNAPAGGADPRTVARMRQLEDALAESK